MTPRRDTEDRLIEKIDFDGDGGCWTWLASQDGRGYGQFWTGSRIRKAYRHVYETYVRAIPSEIHLDHLCNNKLCVNPDHLEEVTPAENTRRYTASLTHCPHGHPLDRKRSNGRRYCGTCNRGRCHRYYYAETVHV